MAKRIAMTLMTVIIGGLAVIFAILLIWSPGKLRPILNTDGTPVQGSIAEKITIPINGIDQGMIIQSRNPANPVLLYLHGGIPDYFLTQAYPTGLENDFTIVWWDQRGSGLSYWSDIPPETMTPAQLIADTIEVTHYLQARFGQDRIYLMGRSGGTFLGLQVAAQAPENYLAYIAIGQITDQLRSERQAYDFMLARYRDIGDAGMVGRLEAAPPPDAVPLSDAYMRLRDPAMHGLGIGTTRDMRSVGRDLFLRSLQNREFTLGEKIRLWRGKFFSAAHLWNTQLGTDLTGLVKRLDIPVYFFHGRHDYTVSYPLARSYFDMLEAPVKGFYTFEESAHSPHFEESDRMLQIMQQDVTQGTTGLADQAGTLQN